MIFFLKKQFQLFAFACILMAPVISDATTYNFTSENYKAAEKADSHLRFVMRSTKLGIFKSHFNGYVKTFEVQGNVKKNTIEAGALVTFQAKDIDTDIEGRNEKMWDQCLDIKNHPVIQIKLNESINLSESFNTVRATIRVRGEDFPIHLEVKATQADKIITVDIKGEISLEALKIPDPSIAVASVSDTVEIEAHLIINEK